MEISRIWVFQSPFLSLLDIFCLHCLSKSLSQGGRKRLSLLCGRNEEADGTNTRATSDLEQMQVFIGNYWMSKLPWKTVFWMGTLSYSNPIYSYILSARTPKRVEVRPDRYSAIYISSCFMSEWGDMWFSSLLLQRDCDWALSRLHTDCYDNH